MKKIIIAGLFLFTTFSYSQFRPYVPQNPVNAMRSVGMYKQRIYDERKDWIQSRINGLINAIDENVNEDNFPSLRIAETRDWLKAELIKYSNSYNLRSSDYADNYQFQNIVENFNRIQGNISKSYKYLVDHEVK
jgi:hypothetical protein